MKRASGTSRGEGALRPRRAIDVQQEALDVALERGLDAATVLALEEWLIELEER